MEKLKKFFKGLWTFLNSKVFQYILVISLILFILNTCGNNKELKRDNKIKDQNLVAKTDSLTLEKTKSGGLEASIAGYISSIEDLEKLDSSLYQEVKEEKGKVLSLNVLNAKLIQDKKKLQDAYDTLLSKMGKPIKLNDSTYAFPWTIVETYDENNSGTYIGWTKVGVNIKPDYIFNSNTTITDVLKKGLLVEHKGSRLDTVSTKIKITFGQKVEHNQLRIFAETDFPGFNPEQLKGVLVDPNTIPYLKDIMKEHKVKFPNTWTIGVGSSTGYNFFTGKPYLGIGVNLTYNLYQF
jgi:hypothetical protein